MKCRNILRKTKNIILITDFDGVWTDNNVYTNSEGIESISCSKLDSLGLTILKNLTNEKNIKYKLIILTSELNECVKKRSNKLGTEIVQTEKNKEKYLKSFKEEFSIQEKIPINEISLIYIGNDLNDLGAMKSADLAFCSYDSAKSITKFAYRLPAKGGKGVIRSFVELYAKVKGWNISYEHTFSYR